MMVRALLRFLAVSPFLAAVTSTFGYAGSLLVILSGNEPKLAEDLQRHPEAWAGGLLALPAALLIAHWYRPDRGRRLPWGQLAARAAVLFAGATGGEVVAWAYGLPLYSTAGLAVLVPLYVTGLCVAGWGLLNPHRHRSLLPGAALLLAGSVTAVVLLEKGSAPALFADYAALAAGVLLLLALCRRAWVRRLVGLAPLPAPAPELPPAYRRGRWPQPGEIWWAEVPFTDVADSKDRPVLVYRLLPDHVEVLRSTSQDRLDRPDHILLPTAGWDRRATHDSCLDLRLRQLPPGNFRRYAGPCPPGVWAEVNNRALGHATVPRQAHAGTDAAPPQAGRGHG